MAKIRYISFDGVETIVDVPNGRSVMEGAVAHRIKGIDGECGGQMACGTCHVFIDDPEWFARLNPKSETEEGMIGISANEAPNSRLGCQIKVTDALDGLAVRMPKSQP